jgi:glycosyltransferase involved in cell wall biosynthesis
MPAPWPVLLMTRQLDQGGSERQLATIARSLDRSRFAPHAGVFRPGGLRWQELEAAGVPLVHFPAPTLASIPGVFHIARYIRRHGIRLVHTFDTPTNLYGVPAARLAGSALVLSSQRAHRMLTPPNFRPWLRLTDQLADGVVVNCEFLRRHLIEDERVPRNRIHLCYNGIDLEEFHPVRGAKPEPLRDASLVIGVVCALRPEKDLETLLDAFAQIRAEARLAQAGLRLAIIGSGPCLPALQARAAALGILPDCLFEPATPQVALWLHAIDIFVLPSLTEALSNSLMEAMACGCTAVASRTGGNPELVADGETGLLFPPGDSAALAAALRRLIPNPSWSGTLAANAARFIRERFRLETCARRMEEIYSALLAAPR